MKHATQVNLIHQIGQRPDCGHRYRHGDRPTSTNPPARMTAATVHVVGLRSRRNPAVNNMLGTRPAPGGTESTESATYRNTAPSVLATTVGRSNGTAT